MHPNLTLAQSIAKDKQFQMGRKWGLVERIGTKFGGLAELIIFFFFWQTCCFQNWFLVQMRLKWNFLNWVLAKFSGFRSRKFTKLCILNRKLGNFCDFWLKGHGNLKELKNAEKGFFFFFFWAAEGAWNEGLFHCTSP